MSFLKADWHKLLFVNYEVDHRLLVPYLPAGTELDAFGGSHYISLVGMLFKNTRLMGVKVPYHIDFEEVNLRFYVKRTERNVLKRGVVFIKEIVPKPALTLVARAIYNEKYETMPMGHSWNVEDGQEKTSYQWKKKGKWNTMQALTNGQVLDIPRKSSQEFIIERYWGYASLNDKESYEYEVRHEPWKVQHVHSHDISVDFALVYGKAFDYLNQAKPASVMMAQGSAVSIEKRKRITV